MRVSTTITIVMSLSASILFQGLSHAESSVSTVRSFVDGPYGQIHVRIAKPEGHEPARYPLVLFHPTPASGDYFAGFMQLMATDRVVIAIDTPGYGDSARPPEPPSIEGYAEASAVALEAVGYGAGTGGKIDALGYHTGALIAAELARLRPDLVRRIVLPGLPYFTGEARAEAYRRNAVAGAGPQLDGSHLTEQWEHATIAVDAGVSLQRSQELFAEAIQAYPYNWWGYHAAFSYESDTRLPEIESPVLLISTEGSLRDETADAVSQFQQARYVHLEDYTHGVFVVGIHDLAKEIRAFLDE